MNDKTPKNELAERVIALEERLSFLEDSNDAADRTLAEAFGKIEALQKLVRHLQEKLQTLEQTPGNPEIADSQSGLDRMAELRQEIPPHY